MAGVKDLVDQIKAQVRQDSSRLVKQSSGHGLTPDQLGALADRLEKAGQVQEASRRVTAMREANASPGLTDVELKKLAYRQALRELGFEGGSMSSINLLFGNMTEAQDKLAKMAADAASSLIDYAVKLGLGEEGGRHE